MVDIISVHKRMINILVTGYTIRVKEVQLLFRLVSFAVASKTGVQDMYSDLSRHIDFLNIHSLRKLACQAAVTSDAC